jgi:hypothetical protein
MKAKLVAIAVLATVAGALSACATQRAIPYSATDCARASPLPKHWAPSAGERCQHFRPVNRYYRYKA